MSEDYDKLAWALVKDEIRRLTHGVGKTTDFETAFAKILVPNKVSYYNGGSLRESMVPTLRQKLLKELSEELKGFYFQSYKARMGAGNAFGKTQVDSLLFWAHTPVMICDPKKGDRVEKFLELRAMQMALTRKKIIADLSSCFVMVNEHAMYRMIQRGLVDREPLKLLTESIDEWLPYTIVYMLCSRFAHDEVGRGVFIPYKGGALLGGIRFSRVSTDVRDLMKESSDPTPSPRGLRFTDGVKGRRLSDLPYGSILMAQNNGQIGVISIHLNTWIPEAYFQSEQWWVKFQLEKLRSAFPEEFEVQTNILHSPTREPDPEVGKLVTARNDEWAHELSKLFSNRRLAVGCAWNRD